MLRDAIVIAIIVMIFVLTKIVRLISWSYESGKGVVWENVFSSSNLRFFWQTFLYGLVAYIIVQGIKYVASLVRRDQSGSS